MTSREIVIYRFCMLFGNNHSDILLKIKNEYPCFLDADHIGTKERVIDLLALKEKSYHGEK